MDPIALVQIGQTPNDGTGDKLRVAFAKVNENFASVRGGIDQIPTPEQLAAPGTPVGDALGRLDDDTLLSSHPRWGIDATGATDATASLKALLEAAAAGKGKVYIDPGRYLIAAAGAASGGVQLSLTRNLMVRAHPRAEFFSNGLDQRMFLIRIAPTGPENGKRIDVQWEGGRFDLTNVKVSTTVPILETYPPAPGMQGASAVTDGINFAGEWSDGGTIREGFRIQRVVGAEFYHGAHWTVAGGDSGLCMGHGAELTIVENCVFTGCRDLGIYGSSSPGDMPQKHIYRNNKFYNCFNAYGIKRSPENFESYGNYIENCVTGVLISQLLGVGFPITKNTLIHHNNFKNCEITVRTTDYSVGLHLHDNVSEDMGTLSAAGTAMSVYGDPVFWWASASSRSLVHHNNVLGVGPGFRDVNGRGGTLFRFDDYALVNNTASPRTAYLPDGTTASLAAGAAIVLTNDDNIIAENNCRGLDRVGDDDPALGLRNRYDRNLALNCRLPYVRTNGAPADEVRVDEATRLPIHMRGLLFDDTAILARRGDLTTYWGWLSGGLRAVVAGVERWRVQANGAMYFVPILRKSSEGLTASGTTQGGALALTADINRVTTVALGAGVRLPAAVAGSEIVVINAGAAVLKVYPATGGAIDGLTANAPVSIRPQGRASFSAAGTGVWSSSVAERRVLCLEAVGVASALTGTTTETQVGLYTILANTLGPNDQIRITSLWSGTSSANNKAIRVQFGGATVSLLNFTTNISNRHQQQIMLRNSLSTSVGAPTSLNGGLGSSAGGIITLGVDFSSDVPISFKGTLASASETLTLEGYSIELLQGPLS